MCGAVNRQQGGHEEQFSSGFVLTPYRGGIYSAPMSTGIRKRRLMTVRVEPSAYRYLQQAARFDRRTLSSLVMHASLTYADGLRARGWGAKAAPAPRDGRRTEAVA
jgi:hypothetical protein